MKSFAMVFVFALVLTGLQVGRPSACAALGMAREPYGVWDRGGNHSVSTCPYTLELSYLDSWPIVESSRTNFRWMALDQLLNFANTQNQKFAVQIQPVSLLTFRVVRLDNTTGACGFSYDAGKGSFKSAKTFTGTGTNRWREETFTITDAVMSHNGPRGADITLVNLDDKDKIFHIIEVQRGAAKSP